MALNHTARLTIIPGGNSSQRNDSTLSLLFSRSCVCVGGGGTGMCVYMWQVGVFSCVCMLTSGVFFRQDH